MAKKSFKSAYIGSDDFWQFDSDSFSDETQFYGSAWIIPASKMTEKKMEDGDVSRCQMYFEVGRTDGHLFTPTSIIFDDKAGFLLIKGEQGRMGDPENTANKTKAFAIGQLAQRYKNLTESASSKTPARVMVNYIIVDNTKDKTKIQAFIDELNGVEEEELAIENEAENMENIEMNAEEMNAENLPRVNPTVVEGAEDVHGAEEDYTSAGMANPEVFGEFVNDNIIGQGFDGQVIGQNAEEDYTSAGMANPEVFGEFVNDNIIGQGFDGQVIGQNAEGCGCAMGDCNCYGAETEEAMVQSEFGDVGQGNDFGQMRAEEDYTPMEYSPFNNPNDFDPRTMEADDIVDWFQELPLVDRFRLNGWAASALVVGIAAFSGSWFAKNR